MGTNSIGGFSFGLHGYGVLSCDGRVSLRARSFLSFLVCRRWQPCGSGWSGVQRKDEATMLHQSDSRASVVQMRGTGCRCNDEVEVVVEDGGEAVCGER